MYSPLHQPVLYLTILVKENANARGNAWVLAVSVQFKVGHELWRVASGFVVQESVFWSIFKIGGDGSEIF